MKCSHAVVDPFKIHSKRTVLKCRLCDEIVGEWIEKPKKTKTFYPIARDFSNAEAEELK